MTYDPELLPLGYQVAIYCVAYDNLEKRTLVSCGGGLESLSVDGVDECRYVRVEVFPRSSDSVTELIKETFHANPHRPCSSGLFEILRIYLLVIAFSFLQKVHSTVTKMV